MSDQRPPLWVSHSSMVTRNLDQTEAFLLAIGCRKIFRGDEVAVLEVRGGTHIVVEPDDKHTPGDVSFDLMVEDIDATYAAFTEAGHDVTELSRGKIHDWFHVTDPAGNRFKINSTHVPDHDAV